MAKDLSQLSDEELEAIANPQKSVEALSDAQLEAIANGQTPEGYLEVTAPVPGSESDDSDSVAAEMDRAQGSWTPEMLQGALHSKGIDVGKALGNIPESGYNFAKNLIEPFVDFNKTVEGIGRTAVGAVEKLIPGKQDDEKYADAVGQFFKNRYGGMEELKNTIETDPVGFLVDLSGMLGIGAAATSKIPVISKSLGAVSAVTDPLRLAGVPFNNPLMRKMTGNFMERGPWFSDKRSRVIAGEKLNATRETADPTRQASEAARMSEWEDLQGRNPDLPNPTYAQRSGNMDAAAQEQSLSTTGSNMQIFTYNDAKVNDAAVDNVLRQVGREQDLPDIPTDRQDLGRNLSESIEATRRAEKAKVNALYDEVPNAPVESRGIKKAVDEIAAEKPYLTDAEYPGWAINKLKNIFKKANGEPTRTYSYETGVVEIPPTTAEVPFQELHAFRKELGEAIRSAEAGANPNYGLSRNLKKIKGAVDDAIEAAGGTSELADAYNAAKNAYIEYANRFKTGAVNDTLRRGKQITGLNVPDEQIAKKFWTPSGADDLNRAVGPKKATEAMRGYAAGEVLPFLEKEIPDIKGAMRWAAKNRKILGKYGIEGEVSQLIKSQVPGALRKELEGAKTNILNNPALTIPQVNRLLRDLGPALKVLYKDNPAALTALRDYHKVLKALGRNKGVSYSSGSATVEKASNSVVSGLATLAAIKAGQGWVFSSIKNVITGLAKGPLELNQAKINQLLVNATFDPDLAQSLMMLAKNPSNRRAFTNLEKYMNRGFRAGAQHLPSNIVKEGKQYE